MQLSSATGPFFSEATNTTSIRHVRRFSVDRMTAAPVTMASVGVARLTRPGRPNVLCHGAFVSSDTSAMAGFYSGLLGMELVAARASLASGED